MIKKLSDRKYLIIKLSIIGVVIFLVWGFLYTTLYQRVYLKYKIRNDLVLVQNGKIIDYHKLPKSYNVYTINFSFQYNGIQYKAACKKYFGSGAAKELSKTYPVAFEKGNPSNAIILIKGDDFEDFNIEYPDSLRSEKWRRFFISNPRFNFYPI